VFVCVFVFVFVFVCLCDKHIRTYIQRSKDKQEMQRRPGHRLYA